MTDEDFRFHVTASLTRIADALERAYPSAKTDDVAHRMLDLKDLTQVSYAERERLTKQWRNEDSLKAFETTKASQ